MPEIVDNPTWKDEFGEVDLGSAVGGPPAIDDNIDMIGPDLGNEPPVQQIQQPVQIMDNPPEPEQEEPQFIQNEDGSYYGMEKTPKGWKGTVHIGFGGAQEFYGKTKDELIQNILKAQFNASRKIREQNKKLKLGDPTPTLHEAVHIATQTVGRKLTADESFEIKTMFESDPDKALEQWFQKRTGSTPDELLTRANKGQQASNELQMEQANKSFLSNNPTYFPDSNYENFNSLITYLAKHKLRRGRKTGDEQEVLQALVDNGQYTASNLEEAFEELTEAGLLLSAPHTQPVIPAAPTNERIVRTETRPRAGFGIRPNETTQSRTEPAQPPTAKDLDKLTDKEIDDLIALERKAYRERR